MRLEAENRKRAILSLALLLAAVAVALTVISLQDGGRSVRGGAPPPSVGSMTPSPTPAAPAAADGPAQDADFADRPSDGSGARCVLESSGVMTCPRNFSIEGNAVGLYPGATVKLPLTIENPNQEDILVTAITVSVTSTSSSGCDTSNLQAADYRGPRFVIESNDSGSVSLSLTMPREAPDACQGVTFTLSYAGKGEPA